MDATNLIVEYLVAGTLIIVAILAMAASWFPCELEHLLTPPGPLSTLTNGVALTTVFAALAYALGVISEYVGERCFERLLNKIKRERMSNYLKKHKALLRHSPILGSFARQPADERDTNAIAASIGEMRFFVMHHSAPLYADIAAQVSRYRLMRVLFVVEVIMAIAVIGQLRNTPDMSWWLTLILVVAISAVLIANFMAVRSRLTRFLLAVEVILTIIVTRQLYNTPAAFWWLTFILIIAIAIANFMAVRSRLGRYCRAIERAYLILLQDQVTQNN